MLDDEEIMEDLKALNKLVSLPGEVWKMFLTHVINFTRQHRMCLAQEWMIIKPLLQIWCCIYLTVCLAYSRGICTHCFVFCNATQVSSSQARSENKTGNSRIKGTFNSWHGYSLKRPEQSDLNRTYFSMPAVAIICAFEFISLLL